MMHLRFQALIGMFISKAYGADGWLLMDALHHSTVRDQLATIDTYLQSVAHGNCG